MFLLCFLFSDFLLKRTIHCGKKNYFQKTLVVFVLVILAVLVDGLVVLNILFSHKFVAVYFGCPMSHFIAHSMICSLRIWHPFSPEISW
jgi:hypothetical protein